MKSCPKCGKPMEDDELFCSACGAKYEEPAPEAPASPAEVPAFCPNCGERLPEGTVFCPNCGTDIRTGRASAGTKAGKNSHRAVGIAAVLAAAALIAAAVMFLPKLFASPRDKFVSGQKQIVLEGAWKAVTTAADQYNAHTSLSTDMALSVSCKGDKMVERLLRDSSVDLKIDLDEKSVLLNGGLTFMGSQVLSGTFSYDKGKVGFCLPEADPDYYVMELSALGDLMGTDELDGLSELEVPKIPVSTLTRLGETYFDILASAATKDNVKKSDREKIRLEELGGSLEGELYIFEPEAEDIEEMLEKLADQLEKDQDLRGLVKDLLGGNLELLNEAENYDFEKELDDALKDLADELRDGAKYAGRSVEESGFTWTLGVSKGKVVLNKIEMDDGSQIVAYEVDGEGSLVLYATSYGETFKLEVENEKDGKLQEGSVTAWDSYGGEAFRLEYRDVDTGKRSILGFPYGVYDLSAEGETVRLEVAKGESGGTDHILSLRGDELAYELSVDSLELILNTSDKKSTASKPKGKTVDISGYDMGELQELFYDMGRELEYVIDDLESNFW